MTTITMITISITAATDTGAAIAATLTPPKQYNEKVSNYSLKCVVLNTCSPASVSNYNSIYDILALHTHTHTL